MSGLSKPHHLSILGQVSHADRFMNLISTQRMEKRAVTDETGTPVNGQELCSQNSPNTESEKNNSLQSLSQTIITSLYNCPNVTINVPEKTGTGRDDPGSSNTKEHVSVGERAESPYDAAAQKRKPSRAETGRDNPGSSHTEEYVSVGEREERPYDAAAQKRKPPRGPNDDSERQETPPKICKKDTESPTDSSPPLVVKVLKKSRDIQIMCKDNKTREYFNVVGATEKEHVVLRIYVPTKLQSIYIGTTYKFYRTIRKKKYRTVLNANDITITKDIVVPDEIEENTPSLPEDARSGDGVCKTLQQALQTKDRSIVKGKVVQVSHIICRRGGTLSVKVLALKDHETTVSKVTLFGDNAERDFSTGQTLQITAVYASPYEGRTQLTSTTDTECQVIPDASDITVTESDKFVDDLDFNRPATTEVELYEFHNPSIYSCCGQQRCRKKKLIDSQCPTCHKTYTDADILQTCYVRFRYEDNGVESEATLFQAELELVMGEKCDMESEEKLTKQIRNHLPLTFSCTIEQGVFRNITF